MRRVRPEQMLATGIPELQTADDIEYLCRVLCLDMTKEDAEAEFRLVTNTRGPFSDVALCRSLIQVCLKKGW